MTHVTRRTVLAAGTTAIGAALAGCLGGEADDRNPAASLPVASATLYQGSGCDCCGEYAAYLQEHLETDLEIVVSDDLAAVKAAHGIDGSLRSCHTVELDDYVVEGHVPIAVVATLFEDDPEIDGIALPGMPAGSPGMGGEKAERWQIHELGGSGADSVYVEY